MQNPWINFKKVAPYILDIDQQWVADYENRIQKKVRRKVNKDSIKKIIDNHGLRTEAIPFPYYGNPVTAKVVVLQANPGYDRDFFQWSICADMLELDYQNLTHTPRPALYSMMPQYRQWSYKDGRSGTCWYWKRTKQLREIVGWEAVASGLMYMEMFPYRSIKLLYPEYLPPSQQYTFFLLRQLLAKNVWVVMTRMEHFWLENVPELRNYPNIAKLRSSLNVTLSEKNLGSPSFRAILARLSSGSLPAQARGV